MEVLFHFVFELVKIAILASAYAVIVTFIIRVAGKCKPGSWFDRVSKMKQQFWMYAGIVAVLLFLYMSSYWGSHGLGDSARIPVGYGKTVNQIDGNTTYITPTENAAGDIFINEFAISGKFLFAHTEGSEVIVWNMKTGDLELLNHPSGIQAFKNKNDIKDLVFEDFNDHYNKYWHGWRFWLLP